MMGRQVSSSTSPIIDSRFYLMSRSLKRSSSTYSASQDWQMASSWRALFLADRRESAVLFFIASMKLTSLLQQLLEIQSCWLMRLSTFCSSSRIFYLHDYSSGISLQRIFSTPQTSPSRLICLPLELFARMDSLGDLDSWLSLSTLNPWLASSKAHFWQQQKCQESISMTNQAFRSQ